MSELREIALEKLTRVLGVERGQRIFDEVTREHANEFATPDDLHRFATEVARLPAFEGAVGCMLQVTAVLRGATLRSVPEV